MNSKAAIQARIPEIDEKFSLNGRTKSYWRDSLILMQLNEHPAIKVTKTDPCFCVAAPTPVNSQPQSIWECATQVELITTKKYRLRYNLSQISKAQESRPSLKWTKEDHLFPDLKLKSRLDLKSHPSLKQLQQIKHNRAMLSQQRVLLSKLAAVHGILISLLEHSGSQYNFSKLRISAYLRRGLHRREWILLKLQRNSNQVLGAEQGFYSTRLSQ